MRVRSTYIYIYIHMLLSEKFLGSILYLPGTKVTLIGHDWTGFPSFFWIYVAGKFASDLRRRLGKGGCGSRIKPGACVPINYKQYTVYPGK